MRKKRDLPRSYASAFVEVMGMLPDESHAELARKFAAMLARDGVLKRSKDIVARIEDMIVEGEGYLKARVSGANAATMEKTGRLERILEEMIGQPVIVEKSMDPSLLAGFRIKIEDTVIDSSIKGKIHKLRNNLLSK